MKDTKLVKILNETNAVNEAPENRKYMPTNINYRQVFGGSDGTMVKQIKRLSQIAADLDGIREPVSKEIMDGFNGVMGEVHKKMKLLNVEKRDD